MTEKRERPKEDLKKRENDGQGFIDILWGTFRSTKLAIILLIFISITAIVGTIVPQNPSAEQLRVYSEGTRRVLEALSLFDMYHSTWFLAAMALLCINLLICSLDRIESAAKQIKLEKVIPAGGDPERMKFGTGFDVSQGVDTASERVGEFLKGIGGRVLDETRGDNRFFLLNRGRYSRIGVYILHLSIILVVLGSLVGNIFGFHGRLIVEENSSTDQFFRQGKNTGWTLLGFTVACKSYTFNIDPETGGAGDFTSELVIMDGDVKIAEPTLMVNHPFYYKKIGLFQSSYELRSVQSVTVAVRKPGGDEELGRAVIPASGQAVEVPGGGRMKLIEAFPDNRTQTIAGARLELDGGDAGDTIIEIHEGHAHSITAGTNVFEIIVRKVADGSELGRVTLRRGEVIEAPGGGSIRVIEYSPGFQVHGRTDKMALLEYRNADTLQNRRLFASFPDFDKKNTNNDLYFQLGETIFHPSAESGGDLEYSFAGADGLYATILDVNYDPGVWLVWAGCITMFIGLWMAFFWSHRKVWVKVAPGRVSIGGAANRNIQAFESQFAKLTDKLKQTLSEK